MLLYSALAPSVKLLTLKESLTTPLLAPLMAHRLTGGLIVGLGGAQVGLTALGLPGWPCPFLHITGIPCPGCGLSRAVTALLRGDWNTSFTLHAFAPFLLLALILLTGAVVLPPRPRRWLIRQVAWVESRTGITAVLLIGLLVYWLVRLLLFPAAYINLMRG